MLKEYSLKALQTAINQAMKLDEQMPQKLQKLDGKTLEMVITPLNVNFYIRFKGSEMQLLHRIDGRPDTIIHSNPIGLIRLSLLPTSKARSLFNDKIRISGDIELGQSIKKLFDEIDIDWEGHLAHFTGDVVAHQIGSFVRKGLEFKNQFSTSMQQNITEFLQEELRICPSRNELEDFFAEVDELVLSVDRLQAHINNLMSDDEGN
ncbi:TPA: SCP2 sterol-binding domain-containing protein [Legionella pneumophila]|uniref:ubiquinone biosynthesis accessory factor UbiJ n=1 Tax=Legionella pneumophila TaxID=446 RepID=UPI0001E3C2F9|nr:SCP2 sterol-binding domain-containing protein [Legionella pneumophila]MDC8029739.1 Ubiquinone biosynthesis protein UbiJ, contains SCP2 domain [Legionella pneumophila subsp. pneumophila]MDW8869120.1 SCP2 sterol-binding domain-containing protein [Legionella pneumophila]MDW8915130.1 SCP2 sterol-binding domain-containing protein [Legionella pneumophila]MDW8924569.1 SCP2 sterol-binding domain-containing protein [Legionella pneumophila]MDW8930669.1 SCP2 sterol-binding domain-containing protein [L